MAANPSFALLSLPPLRPVNPWQRISELVLFVDLIKQDCCLIPLERGKAANPSSVLLSLPPLRPVNPR